MILIHINIGTNIDKVNQINHTITKLKQYFKPIKCSSIYQSPAVGFVGNDFYNLGINTQTKLTIAEINLILHSIEDQQGRDRTKSQFSDRVIDLDLILYNDVIDDYHNIPRSDIAKYNFILAPLYELMPYIIHPITKLSYKQLWQQQNKTPSLTKHSLNILEAMI